MTVTADLGRLRLSQFLFILNKYRTCLDQFDFVFSFFAVTSQQANLPWETLKSSYKCWTLLKHIFFYSNELNVLRTIDSTFFDMLKV